MSLDDYCTFCGRSTEDLTDAQLDAHGMGQMLTLKEIADYLNLVAQELATHSDMPEAAAIIMGLSVTLLNGTWHKHVAELEKEFTVTTAVETPKQQPS